MGLSLLFCFFCNKVCYKEWKKQNKRPLWIWLWVQLGIHHHVDSSTRSYSKNPQLTSQTVMPVLNLCWALKKLPYTHTIGQSFYIIARVYAHCLYIQTLLLKHIGRERYTGKHRKESLKQVSHASLTHAPSLCWVSFFWQCLLQNWTGPLPSLVIITTW